MVALALAIGSTLEHLLHIQNLLLVFLPVVLVAAVRYGFWLASWVSFLSVVGTSFLLAEPRYSLAVSDPENVWALAIFILTAALTSSLAAQVRQRATAAEYHRRQVEQLYILSSQFASVATRTELIAQILEQVSATLGLEVGFVSQDSPEDYYLNTRNGAAQRLTSIERDAASRCWSERRSGLPGSGTHDSIERRYWSLATAHGVVGALTADKASLLLRQVNLDHRFVDALCDLAAVNLERTALAEEKRKSEMLAATERLRAALLTSVSHDLRTPLSSILGHITSLREYGHLYDGETRREMLETAESETRRLAGFVDNLLHMTRIDAGAIVPRLEMVDMSDAVGSALRRLHRTLAGHVVRVALAADLPMIRADFLLLEQVVVNLLDNAAKYSPPGTAIEITASAVSNSVELSICDEGPGISADDLEHIFERFFRGATGDHRPAGTGLGLAICKGFVEALGGRICAANRADRSGTKFTVSFPADGGRP